VLDAFVEVNLGILDTAVTMALAVVSVVGVEGAIIFVLIDVVVGVGTLPIHPLAIVGPSQ